MKFAHLADCHVGSFRDPKLKNLSGKAFENALRKCIEERVDFILISGDLFNTSLPSMDSLKLVVSSLKKLKDNNIPTYLICGSHDYSPSGRTIIDVIEEAGLAINVMKGDISEKNLRLKFTTDQKTGAKITGIIGRRGQLERTYYENLDTRNLESESGYKIFMFHTALTELKPKGMYAMDAAPLSLLPKGFNYYAGGHVHTIDQKRFEGYGLITYPGPLFPNSFREIEEIGMGGFYIVDEDKLRRINIKVVDFVKIIIDAKDKPVESVMQELRNKLREQELKSALVTIRIEGELSTGKPGDIPFQDIFREIYAKGAYFCMKLTSKLTAKGYEEVKVSHESIDELENRIIEENAGKDKTLGLSAEEESKLIRSLLEGLSLSREEGEKVSDFESRLREDILTLLKP